ncbi:phosphatidylserine decarboxylase [Clostridium omnivorum]|uniref:Phosphatidylserine decarboxylase proenzyme n=1 Tax=Clostridium omnivorum TaxID=1604902 RepID=A0ABQ5N5M0_9CLOT|nr:phosphatidylserine decarboxylase [Clostridium sp. E14]GLC30499.1 phosphatidylserine decarboxylase proenzyme 1 [Clostridium sp. E14]
MIKYYNRKTKNYEIENVAGEKYLNWIYSSPVGMSLLETIVKKKLFSSLYGSYCSSSLSRKKVNQFIKEFNINMDEYENNAEDFKSFNDFFIRKVKKTSRPMDMNKNSLVALGDGKILAYENIDLDKVIQVKGYTYSLRELINDNDAANKYENGICIVLRLCPTDYHRFHFIDSGICSETNKIKGHYYSVNPVALEKVPRLFCENKREWSIFHSDNFGDVLYVEVGATCVGSIIQTYSPNQRVERGSEKGYFKFGGSTVILFLEPNKASIDEDILNHSKEGIETAVLMGETIGKVIL